MVSLRRFALVAAVLACAAFAPGCHAQAGTATVTSGEVDEYPPAYYDGYVVYYDNGQPYYYDRGSVVWVSHSSPHYVGLVNHYHVYGRSLATGTISGATSTAAIARRRATMRTTGTTAAAVVVRRRAAVTARTSA